MWLVLRLLGRQMIQRSMIASVYELAEARVGEIEARAEARAFHGRTAVAQEVTVVNGRVVVCEVDRLKGSTEWTISRRKCTRAEITRQMREQLNKV